MAITPHAVSGETLAPSADPETTGHTISGTMSDGYIVVCLNGWDGSDPLSAFAVTFDGTTMALLASVGRAAFSGTYYSRVFGLAVASKAAGSYTVSVNPAATVDEYDITILSYNGVHQTNNFATAAVTANGNGTAISVVISSASGELVIDAATFGGNESAMGAGQTERRLNAISTGQGVSEEAGAASVTMSWTQASGHWTTAAIALQPSAGAPAATSPPPPSSGIPGAIMAM